MFSGFTDLNSQFAQFTSNLTNLDSLQDGSASSKVEKINIEGETSSHDDISSLEKHIIELQLHVAQRDSDCEQANSKLSAFQQELLHERGLVTTLQEDLRQAREEKSEMYGQFETFRLKSQEEVHELRSKLHQLQCKVESNSRTEVADTTAAEVFPDKNVSLVNLEELKGAMLTIDDLKTRLSEADANTTELAQKLEKQSLSSAAKVEQLENDIQGYLNNIAGLNQENGSLKAILAASEAQCVAYEAKLQQITASATDRDAAICSALDEAQQLQSALSHKEAQVQELEAKIGTLKDKLKDMMHRFAELKSKSAAQIQHLEERVAEVSQLMQAKVNNRNLNTLSAIIS